MKSFKKVLAIIILVILVLVFKCCEDKFYLYDFIDSHQKGIKQNKFCVDLANMSGEWDTIYHYSCRVAVRDINKKFGVSFKEEPMISSRVIVLHKGEVVSAQEYTGECSGIYPTVVFFLNDTAVITRDNAVRNVSKLDKEYYVRLKK